MSFDALTIGGLLLALISGGFFVGVVSHNGRARTARGAAGSGAPATAAAQDS